MAMAIRTTSNLKPNSSCCLPPFRSLNFSPQTVNIVPQYGLFPSLRVSCEEIETRPMANFMCKSQSNELLAHPVKYTKRALILVNDKTNLAFLARSLRKLGYKIFSTGETATALHEAGVLVTEKPSLIDLLMRDNDDDNDDGLRASIYDLYVVDYPFFRIMDAAEIKSILLKFLTKIDSLVVVDPQDYCSVLAHLEENLQDDNNFRRILNLKVGQLKEALRSSFSIPDEVKRVFPGHDRSVANAIQHHGKEMSRKTYKEANVAWNCVSGLVDPSCAVIRDMDPHRVASRDDILEAHKLAVERRSIKSLNRILAFNVGVDEALALQIRNFWFGPKLENGYEVVLAPAYSKKALEIICGISKDLTVLEAKKTLYAHNIKFRNVSEKCPTKIEIDDVMFAWHCVMHSRSEFLVAKNKCVLGTGGWEGRYYASEIGLEMAIGDSGEGIKGAVLASDFFFSWSKSSSILLPDWMNLLEKICESGVSVIVGRCGEEIINEKAIECCNKNGVALLFAEPSNSSL